MYVPLDSLFISTQFFVLNLDGWFDVFSNNFFFFDIPLLYYYTNLNSSINCCDFLELYFFLLVFLFQFWIFFSSSFKLFWEYNSFEVFKTLVILSVALLPLFSFLDCSLCSSFYCICCRFFWNGQDVFDYIYCLKF